MTSKNDLAAKYRYPIEANAQDVAEIDGYAVTEPYYIKGLLRVPCIGVKVSIPNSSDTPSILVVSTDVFGVKPKEEQEVGIIINSELGTDRIGMPRAILELALSQLPVAD